MTAIITDAPTELAPAFAGEDTQGHPVALADFRGKQHVVLVFNRGLA